MRTFALTIAYDGTRYAGWQNQINAISIQQRMEEAVEKAFSEKTSVVAVGEPIRGTRVGSSSSSDSFKLVSFAGQAGSGSQHATPS